MPYALKTFCAVCKFCEVIAGPLYEVLDPWLHPDEELPPVPPPRKEFTSATPDWIPDATSLVVDFIVSNVDGVLDVPAVVVSART